MDNKDETVVPASSEGRDEEDDVNMALATNGESQLKQEVDGDATMAAPRDRSRSRSRARSHSRSRSRSPRRNRDEGDRRSRSPDPYSKPRNRDAPPQRGVPVHRPNNAPADPEPTETLGVFGLSVRTIERDLQDEFSRHGQVETVTIVYDQRSGRSRGFGFIKMASKEDAANCIAKLNGLDLNGRRMRVDFSVTKKPHQPTPGEYMGVKRPEYDGGRDRYPPRGGGRGGYDDRRGGYDDRRGGGGYSGGGGGYGGGYDDRDRSSSYRDSYGYYAKREPYAPYSRDSDRDRRSPPRRRRDSVSPPPRRSRYSVSPDPRDSKPAYTHRDYDAPPPVGDRPDPRY